MTDGPMGFTWNPQTGRFTSFAIKPDALLQDASPGTFDFKYYDLAGHRVARCLETEVYIDSASRTGAVVLLPGVWVQTEVSGTYWKWDDGMSTSEIETRAGRRTVTEDTTLSAKEAMMTCLKDVTKRTIFVLLVRSLEDTAPTFHGVIHLNFAKKYLELVPDTENRDTKSLITWGSDGSQGDYERCLRGLLGFCSVHEGPLWREQFAIDGCDEILREMMEAWNQVHGFPVYSEVNFER